MVFQGPKMSFMGHLSLRSPRLTSASKSVSIVSALILDLSGQLVAQGIIAWGDSLKPGCAFKDHISLRPDLDTARKSSMSRLLPFKSGASIL